MAMQSSYLRCHKRSSSQSVAFRRYKGKRRSPKWDENFRKIMRTRRERGSVSRNGAELDVALLLLAAISARARPRACLVREIKSARTGYYILI